jgi:hypothetical protein
MTLKVSPLSPYNEAVKWADNDARSLSMVGDMGTHWRDKSYIAMGKRHIQIA